MARLTENELVTITRQEVEKYEGNSPHAKAYAISDDTRQRYTVNGIENEPGSNHAWIIVQAHIEGQFVVVDEDNLWDKNLWKALEAAGVPREQIILAYLGEHIPESSEV